MWMHILIYVIRIGAEFVVIFVAMLLLPAAVTATDVVVISVINSVFLQKDWNQLAPSGKCL